MKKLFMISVAALLLVACSEGTKNKVENTSGTKMGEVFSQVKALAKDQVDLEQKINDAVKEVSDEYDKKAEGKSKREKLDMVNDFMKDSYEATKKYQEELKAYGEKWKALGEQLEDIEIPTEVSDGTPLKIVEPFHVEGIEYDFPYVKVKLEAEAQTTVDASKIQKVNDDYGVIRVEGLTKDGVAIEFTKGCRPEIDPSGKVEMEIDFRHEFRDLAKDNYRGFDEWRDVEKLVISWEGLSMLGEGGEATGYVGELGLFELKGKVKKCTWIYDGWNVVRTFDENGFWKTNDGQSLSSIYPSGITRDSQKRITKGKMDADGNGETYAYNADGSKKSYNYAYFDEVNNETYKYDDKGVMTSMTSAGPDGEWKTSFTISKTDEHGNWTERKTKANDGSTSVEKRKIEYYD